MRYIMSLNPSFSLGGTKDLFEPGIIMASRAPTSSDNNFKVGQEWYNSANGVIYEYSGAGVWNFSSVPAASTTVVGVSRLATVAETVAGVLDTVATTPAGVAAVAIAGAPDWSEVTKGIVEKATTAEAQAGTDDDRGMTPLKTFQALATPPAIGSTTPAAGTFTDLTADGTGTVSLGANAASNFTITGAFDLTLASTLGSLVVNAGEAAADAIDLNATSGGFDVDVALLASITSTRNNAQAILLESTAGGIDILASGSGGAGEDIDIVCTGGSVNISGTENVADAVTIAAANGGIDITCGGAAAEDIDITNTAGSIRLTSGEAVADSMVFSSAGGIDADAVGQVNIASSQNAADSIVITSSSGGIDILAAGAVAGEDIDIIATGSSVNIESTEDAALAVYLHANGGVSETIRLRADQGTGVASVDILSDVGGITLTAGLATADAINIVASNAAGGIDIDAGTAGIIADTTGGISLDSAAASNFTATGAFNLTVNTTAGSLILAGGVAAADAINMDAAAGGLDVDVALQMNLDSSQAAADAVRVNASNAAGGIDVDAGTGGITIDTTGTLSLDSAGATNLTATGAFDVTVSSTAGSIILSAGENAADSIQITSSGGGIDISCAAATAGEDIDIVATGSSVNIQATENVADSITIVSTAGGIDLTAAGGAAEDIDIVCTAGSVNITAGEAAADSMVLTSNGLDIVVSGAAGRDIDITNTGGSINITATENISSALVINCSGAASGASIDAGTLGLTIGTGLILPVTSVATAASPYAVLGTDYFITTDSTGGAMEITLPAVPVTGRTLIVYDGAGQAAAGGNVTINGNGVNIAAAGTSAATKVLNTAYESYTLTFNGTIWCAQNIV